MKLFKLSIFLLCISVYVFPQEINNYGHFIEKEKTDGGIITWDPDKGYRILFNGSVFKGNMLLCSEDKIISCTTIEESFPSTLRIYDTTARLLYEEEFLRIINPVLTADKKYFSFYDSNEVYVIDLQTLTLRKEAGSLISYVNNDGTVTVYKDGLIKDNGISYTVQEAPLKILKLGKQVAYFTRNGLYSINNGTQTRINVFTGTFFEAKILDNILYYVIKNRTEEGFRFTVYKSKDLLESTVFQTKELQPGDLEKKETGNKKSSGFHEAIRGPMNYADDNYKYNIGNSYGEIQSYGSNYLHPGIDILGNPWQDIYAVKTGVLKGWLTTGGDLYWRAALANKNTNDEVVGYLYAHLDYQSVPYSIGDTVYEGAYLGQIVEWPIDGFNHIHFARIKCSGEVWDGSWWTVNNPLIDISNLKDTIPPDISGTGDELFAFKGLDGAYQTADNLNGGIDIISKIQDNCNSDYNIDVFEISYSLSPANSPGTVLFEKLAFRFDMPLDVYIGSGVYSTLCVNTIYQQDDIFLSQGNYFHSDFYHVLTNSDGSDSISSACRSLFFNTAEYENGQYYLKVKATDAKMNVDMDSMLIVLNNKTNEVEDEFPAQESMVLFPNPVHEVLRLGTTQSLEYELCGIQGNLLISGSCNGSISVSELASGFYLLKLFEPGEGRLIAVQKFIKQ